MKTPIHITTLGLAALLAILPGSAKEQTNPALKEAKASSAKVAAPTEKPAQAKVQLAILLDTSSSMSGLIEQTKTQLWKIVNTFIDAKQNGQVPYVEVALYEYGKSSLDQEQHWIRQIQPLTRDLDEISKQLFALKTNGGQEYCGAVIQRAAGNLKWDPSSQVYKAIFIAGNEAFTQGPINASDAVKSSIAQGVIVNTIHCGSEQAGISGGWKNGAMLADGKFLTIDHNRAVVHIEAPQDAEIVKLNAELNKTYLAYGTRGASKKHDQVVQDNNAVAKRASGAAVQRAVAKGSANYWNGNWDLVDASKKKDFDLNQVKKEQLPKEMQSMTPAQRLAHIRKMSQQRATIQKQILELNQKRTAYVAAKRKELAEKEGGRAEQTLDEAVAATVRAQAEKKGYAFRK
ncbi:VWA domain-containing protein [Verrucomicrobiaceae bacterium R5-34]|nr:VWA domain-containing protein [Verrucomicrobiaceae bacterium R5-34]